jgi:hypothetical protein
VKHKHKQSLILTKKSDSIEPVDDELIKELIEEAVVEEQERPPKSKKSKIIQIDMRDQPSRQVKSIFKPVVPKTKKTKSNRK